MAKKRKLILFQGDKALWIIIAGLFLVSLLVVYSSTAAMAYREVGGNTSYYLMRQARFIMIGFFLIIVVHRLDYRFYARYAKALFQLSVVLVILAYIIGVSLNDAARWIKIPGLGFTFQPSELLKVTLIVVLSQQLGVRQYDIARRRLLPALTTGGWSRNPNGNLAIYMETTKPIVIPIVIASLVVLPANFSTAAIIFFTCLVMLMVGRVRQREINKLVMLATCGIFVIVGSMLLLGAGRAETWVNRLTQFVEPATETLAGSKQSSQDSYQVQQAEIAIASGGIFGKGPGNSTQRSQLPHPYSDFAYAFIIEEYGIVGGIVVFALYLWIFYRAGLIVRRCNRPSQGLMVLGLSLIVTMQAFVNMAVSVGLMPVTGQSLPLISMGGSSVFFTCIAMGMILGVSRESDNEQREIEAQRLRELDPPSSDYDESQPIAPENPSAPIPITTQPPVIQRATHDDAAMPIVADSKSGDDDDDDDDDDDFKVVDRHTGQGWDSSRASSASRQVVDLYSDTDDEKR